jgi:hypothetical protein
MIEAPQMDDWTEEWYDLLLNDTVSISENIKLRIVWMWAYNNLTGLDMK